MRRLRLVESELKRAHPECVTIAIYGSHLKGYAREDSDVDVHLFLNGDHPQGGVITSKPTRKDLLMRLEDHGIRVDQLPYTCDRLDDLAAILDSPGVLDLERLAPYFFPCIDKEAIRPYRECIIMGCEAAGTEEGDWRWAQIMRRLWEKENFGFLERDSEKRKKLYPWTLEEGRKKYLG